MPERLRRFECIVENERIGVWQLHVPTGVLSVNDSFHRLFGGKPGALPQNVIRSRWTERVHAADLMRLADRREQLSRGRCSDYRIEFRVENHAAGWSTLRESGSIVERDDSSDPIWIAGVVTDVTTEVELERRMHAVFDRPFQFIGLTTPAGVVIEAGRAALKRSGYSEDQVLGKYLWDFPSLCESKSAREKLIDGVARAATGESVRFEMCTAGKSGSATTLDFTLTPLQDADGKVVNLIPEGRDITEIVRAREALRTAEDRLNVATRGANLGIWDLRCDLNEIWYNDQWFKLLGYEPGELPATVATYRQLTHPDDLQRLDDSRLAHMSGRTPEHQVEFRMRHKDGSWRRILNSGRAVDWDENGQVTRISGVISDITERRRVEDELQRSHARLERLNSDLEDFVYTASHDLRSPLTGVNSVVQWILDDDQSLSTESRERLSVVQGRIERMKCLLNDIRDYARTGEISGTSGTPITAAALVTQIVASSHVPQGFFILTDPSIEGVQVTRMPLEQVLRNLVNNAIKHHDRPTGIVTVSAEPNASGLRFLVSDDGPGIPTEYRETIFEMFKTLKPRDAVEGSGMGLALVRRIVERLGGHCGVEQNGERGARFWFDWPESARPPSLTPCAGAWPESG